MSATVTTDKLASAFKSKAGKTVYVLFEETYEKNCHPHTPSWDCVSFGEIEHVMRWIFLAGSHCEGGMLQNRNGRITSDGYIAGWMKELANPVAISDREFELKAGANSSSNIPQESVGAVHTILARIGRQDVADHIAAGGTYTVKLFNDAALLCALYTGGKLAPWRLFSSASAPLYGARDAGLGYCPAPQKGAEAVLPAFLKLDQDNRLIQRPDGSWYCGGWEYSVLEHFVANLWRDELAAPGSFRKRIKSFRDAIKCAPQVEGALTVLVDLSVPVEEEYQRTQLAKLSQKVPGVHREKGYEIVIDRHSEHFHRVTNLPADSVSWMVPSPTGAVAASQMSLIEA